MKSGYLRTSTAAKGLILASALTMFGCIAPRCEGVCGIVMGKLDKVRIVRVAEPEKPVEREKPEATAPAEKKESEALHGKLPPKKRREPMRLW